MVKTSEISRFCEVRVLDVVESHTILGVVRERNQRDGYPQTQYDENGSDTDR